MLEQRPQFAYKSSIIDWTINTPLKILYYFIYDRNVLGCITLLYLFYLFFYCSLWIVSIYLRKSTESFLPYFCLFELS